MGNILIEDVRTTELSDDELKALGNMDMFHVLRVFDDDREDEHLYIVASPKIQDMLRLSYEAWQDMTNRINSEYTERSALNEKHAQSVKTLASLLEIERIENREANREIARLDKWVFFYRQGNFLQRIFKVLWV